MSESATAAKAREEDALLETELSASQMAVHVTFRTQKGERSALKHIKSVSGAPICTFPEDSQRTPHDAFLDLIPEAPSNGGKKKLSPKWREQFAERFKRENLVYARIEMVPFVFDVYGYSVAPDLDAVLDPQHFRLLPKGELNLCHPPSLERGRLYKTVLPVEMVQDTVTKRMYPLYDPRYVTEDALAQIRKRLAAEKKQAGTDVVMLDAPPQPVEEAAAGKKQQKKKSGAAAAAVGETGKPKFPALEVYRGRVQEKAKTRLFELPTSLSDRLPPVILSNDTFNMERLKELVTAHYARPLTSQQRDRQTFYPIPLGSDERCGIIDWILKLGSDEHLEPLPELMQTKPLIDAILARAQPLRLYEQSFWQYLDRTHSHLNEKSAVIHEKRWASDPLAREAAVGDRVLQDKAWQLLDALRFKRSALLKTMRPLAWASMLLKDIGAIDFIHAGASASGAQLTCAVTGELIVKGQPIYLIRGTLNPLFTGGGLLEVYIPVCTTLLTSRIAIRHGLKPTPPPVCYISPLLLLG
jgi:hypothetical protein